MSDILKRVMSCFIAIILIFVVFSTPAIALQEKKEEKVVWVPIASKGLQIVGGAFLTELLIELAIDVGFKMNGSSDDVVKAYISDRTQAELLKYVGKSADNKVAMSYDMLDDFLSYLDDSYINKPDFSTNNQITYYLTSNYEESVQWEGFTFGPYSVDTEFRTMNSSKWYWRSLKKGYTVTLERGSPEMVATVYDTNGVKVISHGYPYWPYYSSGFSFPNPLDYGNFYTGKKPSGYDKKSNNDYIYTPAFSSPVAPNKWNDVEFNGAGCTGVLKPDGDIESIVDTSDPIGTVEYADISNIISNVPVDYEKNTKSATGYFVKGGVNIVADTWVHKNLITADDETIKQRIMTGKVRTTLNDEVIETPIKSFKWIRSPSSVKNSPDSNGGGSIKFEVNVQVPYPATALQNAKFKIVIDCYQGNNIFEAFEDEVVDVDFKEVTSVDPPPPPVDPPVPPDEGGGTMPPVPPLPEVGGFTEYVAYMVDLIIWFFQLLLWIVAQPFVFVYNCISSLSGYIVNMVNALGGVGKNISSVLSWLPNDILNILWGMMSLIIIFCSVKLFKNFSNK